MTHSQRFISSHKQEIKVNIVRIATYCQCKLIELKDDNNQVYFAFFYKNKYLTSLEYNTAGKQSFVTKTFTSGIVLHSPNLLARPILPSVLKPCSFQELTAFLERNFSLQEIPLIVTFFESFFPKKELFAYIKKIFYHFQRNGQTFQTYRVVRLLSELFPNQQWVKDFSRKAEYQTYEHMYQEREKKLFSKDPLFAEQILFLERKKEDAFLSLKELYLSEERITDLILLYCDYLHSNPFDDNFQALIELLDKEFHPVQAAELIEQLTRDIPINRKIQLNLFDRYLNLEMFDQALSYMSKNQIKLSDEQLCQSETLLEALYIPANNEHSKNIMNMLLHLMNTNPQKAETILGKYIHLFLETKGLSFVKDWIKPLASHSFPILRKIKKIYQLQEDPDNQLELGKLYYEFHLYDKAIECFQWEMELHETDIESVRWLSKIYFKLGMNKEHEMYHQLSIDMLKRA